MNLRKKLTIAACAAVAPVGIGLAGLIGLGGAATAGAIPPYTATGSVSCTGVAGGIQFLPPLSLPAPLGTGGPVAQTDNIGIELSGCTAATDTNVVFTGLNGGSIDGVISGKIVAKSDSLTGLAGGSSETLTVNWVGAHGPSNAPLKGTTISVKGDQPTEGSASAGGDAGNVGFFTGNNGSQGFAGMSTEGSIATGSYSWAVGSTPGGVNNTELTNATTTIAKVDVAPGESLTTLETDIPDLVNDPVSDTGGCIPANDYINSVVTSGTYAGDIALKTAATGNCSADTLNIALPLSVTGYPAGASPAAGLPKWTGTSNATAPTGQAIVMSEVVCTTSGTTVYFVGDPLSPQPLCVEIDKGAPTAAPAVWVWSGTIAAAVTVAQGPGSEGLAVTDPDSAAVSATSSFNAPDNPGAAIPGGNQSYGDVLTNFSSDAAIEGASFGSLDGYNNTAADCATNNAPLSCNFGANPDGIDYLATTGTDGLVL